MKTSAQVLLASLAPAFLASVAAFALTACSTDAAAPVAPAPEVHVARPLVRTVPITKNYPAILEAVDRAVLHAQVSGYLESIRFDEGSLVAEGDVLFRLDARVYEARLADAEASLRVARAEAQLAKAENERSKRLLDRNATSAEEKERRDAQAVIAEAKMQEAAAAVRIARLNLDFTTIRAPFAGRIGRANVTRGNLVTPADELAVLVALDSLHVRFDIDESEFFRMDVGSSNGLQVNFAAAGQSASANIGRVAIIESEVGLGTGTVRLRARISNVGHRLLPGMFGTAELSLGTQRDALLIDEKAIGTMQGQRYVLIVNDNDVLEPRTVTVGNSHGELRQIEAGVSPLDRVVVNGLMRGRPGTSVTPVEASMPTLAVEIVDARVASEF